MKKLLILTLLVGCGHQTHTVGGITSIAEQNTILAYKDYVGKEIHLTGKVVDIGVDSDFERGVIEAIGKDADNVYVFVEGKNDLHPFVVLADTLRSYNIAVCFFQYKGSGQASHYRVGMNSTVSGQVYRFVTLGKRTVVILKLCEVTQ